MSPKVNDNPKKSIIVKEVDIPSGENEIIIVPSHSDSAFTSDNPVLREDASPSPFAQEDYSPKVTKKAIDFLRQHKDRSEINQVIAILCKIEKVLAEYELTDLSEPRASIAEDGVIAVSWEIGDASLGIALQPDGVDSSWFLIAGNKDRVIRADGNLDGFNEEVLLDPLAMILRKNKANNGERK